MSQKSFNHIGIIGKGKVATALVQGFKNHSFYKNVEALGKDYFSSNYTLDPFDTLILAVRPDNAIEMLKNIKGKVRKNSLLISFVSGLTIDQIARVTKTSYDNIIRATLNTNVSHGNGIIYFSTASINSEFPRVIQDLFNSMTTAQGIVYVDTNKVLPGVVHIGAMNAFDAKFIKLLHGEKYSEISLPKFLAELSTDAVEVKKYLELKKETLTKLYGPGYSIHRHSGGYPSDIHVISFKSTLQTLLEKAELRKDIDEHIKTVTTPNGCTEAGINSFHSLRQLFEENNFYRILLAVHRKTKSFQYKIQEDFIQNFDGVYQRQYSY